MGGDDNQQESVDLAQRVAYVRQMLGELRALADIRGCEMLCYLIEMAYVEAGDIQLRPVDSDVDSGKGDRSAGMAL